MRQLLHLLDKIRVRNTTEAYYRDAFLAKLHHAEIAPLEQILGVSSSQGQPFDPQVDKAMDEHAQKLLREKKWLTTNF